MSKKRLLKRKEREALERRQKRKRDAIQAIKDAHKEKLKRKEGK